MIDKMMIDMNISNSIVLNMSFAPRMKENFYLKRLLPILLFGVISACQSYPLIGEVPAQKSIDLKNITLNISDLAGKPAKLVNGKYQGDHLTIHSLHEAAADFNRDGLIDGVVIIMENSGGTGNFRALCLLLNNGEALIHTTTAYIGDRIEVKSLNTNEDKITVEYLDRRLNDGMAVKPYIEKTIEYQVKGVKLEQVII